PIYAPGGVNPCRPAADQNGKTCRPVAFSQVYAAGADYGKVYALGNTLLPWQTRPRAGAAPIAAELRRRKAMGVTTLADGNPLQGVKVMVIDDSNTIRRSAEIFLLQAGCTVVLAEDGFDALAKIAD